MRAPLIAVAALLLAGCASGGSLGPFDTYDPGVSGPGELVETVRGVEYYPSCGNEVLQYVEKDSGERVACYPFKAEWSTPEVTASGFGTHAGGKGIAAAPAPAPGDEKGTLLIYDNDIAFFQSADETVHTWLTTDELTYTWVC